MMKFTRPVLLSIAFAAATVRMAFADGVDKSSDTAKGGSVDKSTDTAKQRADDENKKEREREKERAKKYPPIKVEPPPPGK